MAEWSMAVVLKRYVSPEKTRAVETLSGAKSHDSTHDPAFRHLTCRERGVRTDFSVVGGGQ
jgi:hypothetical protein